MALRPTPVATYRVQLTPANDFAAVAGHLDRLGALGISHLYLSPVTEAIPGSTHGYDVTDHTQVRAELGGMDGLMALLDGLADRGMGALVDHVPNHVSIGRPELNPRWWQLLAEGSESPAAGWFDVDWDVAGGRVVLPVLGRPLRELLDDGVVTIDASAGVLQVGPQRFPLASDTDRLPVDRALIAQHYTLQWWRDPRRNVRRFFTIDDLVAVRVEDPMVAHAVDTVPRQLLGHRAFAGVRVDHVDGLADPGAYLGGLRELLGDRWLLVEKILAGGETLPAEWPSDGATGYEHARALEQAMLDGTGFARLRDQWGAVTGDVRPYPAWEADARREALAGGLRPDVLRVARRAVAVGVEGEVEPVADAVTALCADLGRYRTYLPHDPAGAEAVQRAYEAAAEAEPDRRPVLDQLVLAIAADAELRTRWQQLTGPATAKGVEDRVFFRYLPLSTLNEVGAEPDPEPDDAVRALHDWHRRVAASWPRTLLAGTTHDTKRSEDVRARGLALADAPDRWATLVGDWAATARPEVDPAAQWLALQTVVAAGPISPERLEAFLVKAAREAGQHTSWTEPDRAYEAALAELARWSSMWPPARALADELAPAGRVRTLAMLAVRLTAPGVPDVYQGTEAFRFVLTDPDNRTEPDHDELAALVERAGTLDGPAAWAEPGAPAARAVVLRRVLAARRAIASLAGYQPLTVVGPDGHAVIAFSRLDDDGTPVLVTVVAADGRTDLDAVAALPGRWRHVLDDGADAVADTLDVGAALGSFPACVLVRDAT